MNMQVLGARRDMSGGYKVDVSRGERIGRVSSEWFSRPADERYLSLSDLAHSVRSHRVMIGRAEIGAAWSKTSNEGRNYLGLKLDDPSFNAPIYANLFDDEEGDTFSLIWSRPNGLRGD